jgi:oxazoline/thiazoline synthase
VHELVERDAVALWWYNRLQKPLLKFDANALPLWLPFSNWISRCGRLFWLLDLTADLPGTVTVAISCDHNGQDVSFGFGAAQTPEAAAENAMGELVQFEVTKRHSKNNGKPNLMTWAKTADVKNYPFLKPSDIAPKIVEKMHDRCGSIVEELKKQGLEGFFIDITLPEQHAKAVRVIIPGLRQIWPRFAPGRLYDVPHRLGWLDRPLTEIELNPVPLLY